MTQFRPSVFTQDFDTPLRRFKGILKEYEWQEREFDQADGSVRKTQTLIANFTDVEVIETDELYPFPTAKVAVRYSTSGRTIWSAFGQSIIRVLGAERAAELQRQGTFALDELVGREQEWVRLPCAIRVNNPPGSKTWVDDKGEGWQVAVVPSLASTNKADLHNHVLSLLNGKTTAQFQQALYTDPQALASGQDYIVKSTQGKLLPELRQSGVADVDDAGVWRVV